MWGKVAFIENTVKEKSQEGMLTTVETLGIFSLSRHELLEH
jgi:hypothetical protein